MHVLFTIYISRLSASSHPSEMFTMPSTPTTLNYTSLSALTRHSALSATVSSPSIAGRTPLNPDKIRSDRRCWTKVGTTSRRRHSRRHYCSCYKNSKESRFDNRQRSVLRRSRQQRVPARQLIFTSGLYVTSAGACQSMTPRQLCHPGWITATRAAASLQPTSISQSVRSTRQHPWSFQTTVCVD